MLILDRDLAICVDPPVVDLSFGYNNLFYFVYYVCVAIEVVPPVPSPSPKSCFFFFVRLRLFIGLDFGIYGSFSFFCFASFIFIRAAADDPLSDF